MHTLPALGFRRSSLSAVRRDTLPLPHQMSRQTEGDPSDLILELQPQFGLESIFYDFRTFFKFVRNN